MILTAIPASHNRTDVPSHHVGSPPVSFQNPWPSFRYSNLQNMVACKLGIGGHTKNWVPVPENREGLVHVRKPDWGLVSDPKGSKMKATWIGHATWLVETGTDTATADASRGVRIFFDPLFSERTSPFSFVGPKRYTPTPCSIDEAPEVDVVCLSHLHYDHADTATLTRLHAKNPNTQFLAALGGKQYFTSIGIKDAVVREVDWWDEVSVEVRGVGKAKLVCTPAQHSSARGVFDRDHSLWCSWAVVEERGEDSRRLFFAGDTGYRQVDTPHPTPDEEAAAPSCPAFREIGAKYGPFDLALLPIGLCAPRDVTSSQHCAPEDSVCVHRDIRSKKSIGMHYGTVRGGLSGAYEPVTEPPRKWRDVCEKAGLKWGEEAGLCDVGETVSV